MKIQHHKMKLVGLHKLDNTFGGFMREKKITYSKLLPIITGAMFVVCLYEIFTLDITSAIDTTVYVTALSVTGAIFGTATVNYFKKANAENSYKMKSLFYRSSMKDRLYFNEQMMILKQKYAMTDEDVMAIDNEGEADETMNDAYVAVTNQIENEINDSETVQEVQSFNL